MKKTTLSGILAAGLLFMPAMAQAAFPDKPVTIVVPWSAGGATDLLARAIETKMGEKLGTSVVIRNVAGASGTLGAAEVAKSAPDGYTMLFTPQGVLTIQPQLRHLPYTLDSFRAVGRATVSNYLTMVAPNSPYTSMKELLAATKTNPDKVVFASTGVGTLPHLSVIAIEKSLGIKAKHVPYKASPEAGKAILGGEATAYSEMSQLAEQMGLRPLACWSATRCPNAPDVPTMKELGYDYVIEVSVGVFVPKATPDAAVNTLSKALKETLNDPSVKENFKKLKATAAYVAPAAFDEMMQAEAMKNRELLTTVGIAKK